MAGPIAQGLLAARENEKKPPVGLLRGLSLSPYGEDGWQVPPMIQGLLSSAINGATAPGRALSGELQMADPRTGRTSPEAIAAATDLAGLLTLGSGAIPAGANEMRMGIKAYHGSPHSFDKFDLKKLGTGEGNQSYGHGLYFADHEDVGRYYRDSLTADAAMKIGRDDIMDVYNKISEKADTLPAAKAQLEYSKMSVLEDLMNGGDVEHVRALIRDGAYEKPVSDWFEASVAPSFSRRGSLVEVDLNTTPERLLDWDKKLSDQPKSVQAAVKKAYPSATDDMTGAQIYTQARDNLHLTRTPARPFKESAKDISEKLRKKGVDGIQYLDEGSRTAGIGTRNYVVFDDNIISIVKKYGIVGALSMGAITLAQAKELSRQQKEAEFSAEYAKGNAT